MKQWNSSIRWERKSDYILTCMEELFAPSNGGSPMVTLDFEVKSPETVEIDGEDITVAGTKMKLRMVIAHENPEYQASFRAKFVKMLNAFELPTDNIDWNNPTLGFKGKSVYALVEDNAVVQRGSPTKSDLAKGVKEGPVLVNPKTKLPLVKHYPQIAGGFDSVEIYGIADVAGAL